MTPRVDIVRDRELQWLVDDLGLADRVLNRLSEGDPPERLPTARALEAIREAARTIADLRYRHHAL
jgi:hypothetical protein